MRKALLACMLATLVTVSAGCLCPSKPRAWASPAEARAAFERVNDNQEKIAGALYAPATVSVRFRDADDRDRRFIGHPATIIFEGPRCLYFDIKSSLAGSVARIGANGERYWLWIDANDNRKLWWGSWDALEIGAARTFAVRPDQLLDVLLLRPLPRTLRGGIKPVMEYDDQQRARLLLIRFDPLTWPYVARELVLDPNPPHLPIEVIDYDARGQMLMHAELGNYRKLSDTDDDAPYTPRRYVIKWLQDDAEMRIDFNDVRYREKETPFCTFPDGWRFAVESLDLRNPSEEPAPQ